MTSLLGGAPIDDLVLAFVLTVLIEVPIVVTIVMLRTPTITVSSAASTAFVANLVTHPLGIWIALPLLGRAIGFGPALVIVEAMVVVVEAAIYTNRFGDGVLAAVISGVANLASFGLGVLLLAQLPFV